jgi:hypothetical protein
MDAYVHIEQLLEDLVSKTGALGTVDPLDVNIVTPVNALTVLITSVDGGSP